MATPRSPHRSRPPSQPPLPLGDAPPRVEVRRSARRQRTVSAHREGDVVVVLLPARMSRAEEARWVAEMLERLAAKEERRQPSDLALADRAAGLSQRWLDGRAQPASVRWVVNQGSRWGSCTPGERSIRMSSRLQGRPDWVVDYVLLHELVHLLVPGHGPDFYELLGRYPQAERARGYLEGFSAGAGEPTADDADSGVEEPGGETSLGPGLAPWAG